MDTNHKESIMKKHTKEMANRLTLCGEPYAALMAESGEDWILRAIKLHENEAKRQTAFARKMRRKYPDLATRVARVWEARARKNKRVAMMLKHAL